MHAITSSQPMWPLQMHRRLGFFFGNDQNTQRRCHKYHLAPNCINALCVYLWPFNRFVFDLITMQPTEEKPAEYFSLNCNRPISPPPATPRVRCGRKTNYCVRQFIMQKAAKNFFLLVESFIHPYWPLLPIKIRF